VGAGERAKLRKLISLLLYLFPNYILDFFKNLTVFTLVFPKTEQLLHNQEQVCKQSFLSIVYNTTIWAFCIYGEGDCWKVTERRTEGKRRKERHQRRHKERYLRGIDGH
jgi:hypothetical protein